jgi:hypothetical protein
MIRRNRKLDMNSLAKLIVYSATGGNAAWPWPSQARISPYRELRASLPIH